MFAGDVWFMVYEMNNEKCNRIKEISSFMVCIEVLYVRLCTHIYFRLDVGVSGCFILVCIALLACNRK